MAFYGLNFRENASHINGAPADGSGQTYCILADAIAAYPVTRGGEVFGPLVTGQWDCRDRNSTGSDDPRLCGVWFTDGSTRSFRHNLRDGAGTYNLRVALGDKAGAMTSGTLTVKDGATGTVLATISGSTSADNFLDAAGTNRTSAAWPGSNSTVQVTAAETYLTLEMNAAARIAHVAVEQVVVDGTAPLITGPSGAAGDPTSAKSITEGTTAVHTFTADEAVTWDLNGGADVAFFSINPSTGALTMTARDFETPVDGGANNTYVVGVRATDGSSNAATQTCTVTITNVNEAPSFSGTLSVSTLTEGVAMTPLNAASLFSDPDSGDAGTYSPVGTWPAGVTVSGAGSISGTPTTPGTYSNLRVRRTDVGALTADSNLFTITVSAAAAGPTINTHPSNQTAKIGATATFTASATASSGALTAQWQKDAANISGATNTTSYARAGVALADHGSAFRCGYSDAVGGPIYTDPATLTVAVTRLGTVPDFVGTTGAAGSIDLSSYFAGGLARTFAVLSGTMPTGLAQVGTTAVWSGTLGAAGSGSFVVRATDAASNTDDTNTVDWVIGATTPGTVTGSALKNNAGWVFASRSGISCFVRNPTTGAHLLLKTGITTDSAGVPSFADAALAQNTDYEVRWKIPDAAAPTHGANGWEIVRST